MQSMFIRADPTRTNQASQPSVYMSRLLDEIDHVSNLAFLLALWKDRSKATIADVHKVGNVTISIVKETAQPMANQV